MKGEIIAEGLAFPEGPVWTGDALLVTEIDAGRIARWSAARGLERIWETGGGPNGATLGPDGALYVTQNGGWARAPGHRVPGAIQRIAPDGTLSTVVESVAGLKLDAPNDLAFGPDGLLYFTDPRGAAKQEQNSAPGRLFCVDVKTGQGRLVLEVGSVYPNGIGFARDGTLIWSESFSRRVMRLEGGGARQIIELPEKHFPDGFCSDAAGRLYVASTYGHCVSVIDDGKLVERLMCGKGMPTNCCFGGSDLYVTESRYGTLWRFRLT
jgi:gluconolactonase